MNNNSNKNKNTFLKENGLIVGLYSVVGMLVVTAGVLTVQNLQPDTGIEPLEPVNSNITKSYSDGEIGTGISTELGNGGELAQKPEKKMEDIKTTPKPTTEEDLGLYDDGSGNTYATDVEYLEDEAIVTSGEVATDATKDVATVAMYTAYNDGDKMEWPVTGEVVLPYSNTLAIYDPTLEQFRTNEVVSIKSTVGEDVKASIEGQVVEVASNEIYGNYVVIQHGNGWSTLYGQLEDINVQTSDVVGTGAVIGKTAKPSKYSVALGDHVDFKVVNNERTVNPESVLINAQ